MKKICYLIGLLLLAASTGHAADQAGDVLKIGIVNDQTSSNKGSGRGMTVGVEAYLKAVNEKGGVNGRKFQTIVVDDQMVVDKTIDGLLKLVDEQKVFAVVGAVGTSNSVAAIPVLKEYKLPFIGPRTGATELRTPVVKEMIHIRAGYHHEAEAIVDSLVKKGAKSIAVFYQNDGMGKDMLTGVEQAIKRRGLTLVSTGSCERGTTAVSGGLSAIMAGKPDAIVVGTMFGPGVAFVKLARKEGLKAELATFSAAGGSNMVKALGDASEGLIMSQIVPIIDDLSLPITKECKEAIEKNPAEVGFNEVSMEGCMAAKSFVMALEKAGNPPTREGLISAYESMKDADMGGIKLNLSPSNHTAQDNVYLQVARGNKLVPLKN